MFRTLSLLAITLPLAACISAPKYVPLESTAKNAVREISATSVIHQDEIVIVAQSPGVAAAAGGGLIAALIESQIARSRQDDIQQIIEPFYAAVDDVDFRTEYWAALKTKLQGSYPLKVTAIKTSALPIMRKDLEELTAQSPADKGIMHVRASYTFTPDFTRLHVMTTVDLWQGGQKEKEPVYSNYFYYQSAPVGPGKGDSIKLWANDNGALYRKAVGESIAETMKMFDLDLKYPRLAGTGKEKEPAPELKTASAKRAGTIEVNVTGPVLEESPSRIILRHTDGRLNSLPR